MIQTRNDKAFRFQYNDRMVLLLNFNIFLNVVLSYLINSQDLLYVKDEWGSVQRDYAYCHFMGLDL